MLLPLRLNLRGKVVQVSGLGGEGSYQKWREVYERDEKRKRILKEDDEILMMIVKQFIQGVPIGEKQYSNTIKLQ